jgi:hypothetical protein
MKWSTALVGMVQKMSCTTPGMLWSSRVVLQCGDSLQKLALANRVHLVYEHCGVVSMGMRKPTHLQERDQVLHL